MLPDFPGLKTQIARRLAQAAQAIAQGAPLIRDTSSFRQHEGDRTDLVRTDGSHAKITYEKPLSAQVEIRIDDARKQGAAASVRAIRDVGNQLAEGMTQRMFETLTEAVDAVGNVVDAEGRPFSLGLLLEVLDKMELSFNPDGSWDPPTVVVHPDTHEKIRVQIDELNNDSGAKKDLAELVGRKRKEWDAREARRTLAD
jgi:hypothetical protein